METSSCLPSVQFLMVPLPLILFGHNGCHQIKGVLIIIQLNIYFQDQFTGSVQESLRIMDLLPDEYLRVCLAFCSQCTLNINYRKHTFPCDQRSFSVTLADFLIRRVFSKVNHLNLFILLLHFLPHPPLVK